MCLRDILNVDVEKAKEKAEKEKAKKRQEKSNQEIEDLIEFVKESDKEKPKPNK